MADTRSTPAGKIPHRIRLFDRVVTGKDAGGHAIYVDTEVWDGPHWCKVTWTAGDEPYDANQVRPRSKATVLLRATTATITNAHRFKIVSPTKWAGRILDIIGISEDHEKAEITVNCLEAAT